MNIEDASVKIPTGNIYVKKWTPNNAVSEVPIVLLHDSLGSAELWKNFPSDLAENLLRPVIAYDRLGFGKSDARHELPSDQFIEEEAIAFLSCVKSALGITNYLLLGHSVGGAMAVNIAAMDKACDAVITIAAQAFVQQMTLQGINAAKSAFKDPAQMKKLSKWHGEKAEWVLNAWTDVWLRPSFSGWRLSNVSAVNCPILVIHGNKDEYGSEAFPHYIASNSGGISQVDLIDDCGHMPHKSHTEHVLLTIKQFVDK